MVRNIHPDESVNKETPEEEVVFSVSLKDLMQTLIGHETAGIAMEVGMSMQDLFGPLHMLRCCNVAVKDMDRGQELHDNMEQIVGKFVKDCWDVGKEEWDEKHASMDEDHPARSLLIVVEAIRVFGKNLERIAQEQIDAAKSH